MALSITTKINLDMKAPNAEIVYGNQYDSVGYVQARLLDDGVKWDVPSGAVGIVSYMKSDRIGGYYDTTSDNKTAVTFTTSDRSLVTIALDQQLMTTLGNVSVQVNFYQSGQRLSTFTFVLNVQTSPITSTNVESKWFGNLILLSGLVVDNTLSIRGAAADAKTTGDMINSKVNKPILSPFGTAGQILRTLGNGNTEWTDVGTPTDQQTETAVDNWLDAHPEATTTVQDGAVTDQKLADDVADMFVDGVTYQKTRIHDTDCYIITIPLYDDEGYIIDPYISFDEDNSPFEYGNQHGTTLSINGMCNIQKTDSSWQVPNCLSRGEVIFQSDFTGTPKPNDAQYICIGSDRSFKTYPLTTTSAEMVADDAYTVFDCYYRLVENSTPVDLTNVTANEDGRITDLNPNLAIGVKDDKTIVWFACDGRTDYNAGLDSNQVAAKMADLGCTDAWMMDGGGSTSVTFKGSKLNRNIDDNGMSDRMIRFAFNIKKEDKNDFLTPVYGKIGEEKQNIIQQVVPSVNDLRIKCGYLFSDSMYKIQENDDLNNYTKTGRYSCSPNATAATISNSPTSVTFNLEVTYLTSSQYIQTIEDLSGNVYRRTNHIYGGANHYTAWRAVTYYSYVQNITLQNATAGGNNSFYYKSGTTVTVFLDFTPNVSGQNVVIATLPEGYRPPVMVRTVPQSVANVNRDLDTTYVSIQPNGDIDVYMTHAFRAFVNLTFGTNG